MMSPDFLTKYLIVKGASGLGNRIISLCNAIGYARHTGRILLVDWSDGQFAPKGVNAFPLFFRLEYLESISTFADIPDFAHKSSYPPIWKDTPEKSVWDLYRRGESNFLKKRRVIRRVLQKYFPRSSLRKLQRHWYLYTQERKRASHTFRHAIGTLFSKNDICVGGDCPLRLKEDLVFFVDYCPQFDSRILTNCIRLQPSIEKVVNEFSEEHGLTSNCIGIHIRMTDRMPTATLNHLFEEVKKTPLKNPKIFLATDSDAAREYVQKKYSNVIMIPKVDIDLPEGMGRHKYAKRCGFEELTTVVYRESIIDMFLLSKCEYLFIQENSTFSRVAAILKDEPSKVSCW